VGGEGRARIVAAVFYALHAWMRRFVRKLCMRSPFSDGNEGSAIMIKMQVWMCVRPVSLIMDIRSYVESTAHIVGLLDCKAPARQSVRAYCDAREASVHLCHSMGGRRSACMRLYKGDVHLVVVAAKCSLRTNSAWRAPSIAARVSPIATRTTVPFSSRGGAGGGVRARACCSI
jgi:hypothetical protein